MQNLSALLGSCRVQDGALLATVEPYWLQGRSVYGGAQAALAVQAMLPFSDGLPIRTLQATLCAPIPAGSLDVRARLLRQGGNTRQVEARIVDGEQTLALFVGIFGRARDSAISHDMLRPVVDGRKGVAIPFVSGLSPAFVASFDAWLLEGHFLGSGHPDTRQLYRLSLKDSAQEASLSHVLAFSDYPPPVALSWLKGVFPGSTMTWMLNFTGHAFEGQGLSDWVIEVRLDSAHDGYTQQTVSLFAPDGYAVARGTQCMVVFG